MRVESIGELMSVLESYDELQQLSAGFRKGQPCLFVHSHGDYSEISGYIYLPSL